MQGRHYNNFYLFAKTHSSAQPDAKDQTLAEQTRSMMETKLLAIQNLLRQSPAHEKVIIVGCEDFFESSLGANCFDMDTVYSMFAKEFRELSLQFPNAIICPGSLYISTPIPAKHFGVKYNQEDSNASLDKTLCYTSNIMPVFNNGILLRVIRKGEEIVQQTNVGARKPKIVSEKIADIDDFNPTKSSKLKVLSYHEDELDSSMKDELAGKKGTCYLGKTLLPGEKAIIAEYFPSANLQELFSHDVVIDGESFGFLICGEFNCKDSTSAKMLQDPHDYIIHSTQGGDIFPSLQNCSVYIHSDFGVDSKVLKEGNILDPEEFNKDDMKVLRY